jgi:TonB family protein
VEAAGDLAGQDQPTVQLRIAADGTLEKFTLPERSPDWMKELAGCAVEKFRFAPATRQGVAEARDAFFTIKFRARGPEELAYITVEDVGPLITSPFLVRGSQDTSDCYPDRIRRPGQLSRIVVTMKIMPDGSATDVALPTGSEPWHEETIHCLLDRINFFPGTVDGLPVSAQATLPFVIQFHAGKINTPELRSSTEQLEAAYHACYPPDLATVAAAFYSFDIAANGRVTNPKVVDGTGNARLDEAGVCIMKMLEFTPLMKNGRAMRSHVTWRLPIRPSR